MYRMQGRVSTQFSTLDRTDILIDIKTSSVY